MKVRLKVLPDEPRGGAWPPSARAVRCPVKSGNDRDPRPHLPPSPAMEERAQWGDCPRKREEGVGNGRSVCPEPPGLHARNNGGNNGMRPRKGKLILEIPS